MEELFGKFFTKIKDFTKPKSGFKIFWSLLKKKLNPFFPLAAEFDLKGLGHQTD
jgi:hypothetical protein